MKGCIRRSDTWPRLYKRIADRGKMLAHSIKKIYGSCLSAQIRVAPRAGAAGGKSAEGFIFLKYLLNARIFRKVVL